ncbi:uncharacterized protein QC763_209390 [Podospora pseudopauciseta]|uniref:GAR domain-containing protein n=1 Tax=Podospora pseudopauciseta TaxID=2093780 RepID=A0ABR0HQI3_9PEZI|nr:hypothetical protein QC763_209390 [Podospora pseudopauciseta]
MDDPPPMTAAQHHYAAPRGRQLGTIPEHHATTAGGPRTTDDLLLNLTPRAAVEAFQNPSGSLKTSIDAATPFEQAFAMRAAIASSNIADWLEDLSSWPWPKGGGSAGFEMPMAKRRRVSNGIDRADEDDQMYIGSLEVSQVVRYEKRIDEINQGLEKLDIEEIKTQVLHNHIMPLSRPGTPLLDSGRSVSSALSTLARMDDLTALLTATLMQALPNISKLTRLLSIWTYRLLVLRRIPVFLKSLADAEVALQSGWHAIGVKSTKTDAADTASSNGPPSGTNGVTVLSQKEHEVMKTVLERKVARTGRDLDAMLDLLEGQLDTLPEEWIDRVDSLEHEYGEWTVACEQKIREAELAELARTTPELKTRRVASGDKSPIPPPTPESKAATDIAEPVVVEGEENSISEGFNSSASSRREYFPLFGMPEEPTKSEPRSQDGINNAPQDLSKRLGLPIKFDRPDWPAIKVHEPAEEYDTNPIRSSLDGTRKWSRFDGNDHLVSFDGLEEEKKKESTGLAGSSSEQDRVSDALDGTSGLDTTGTPSYHSEDEYELTDGSDDFVPQPDLPVLPRSRRASDSGTVVHEASLARFMDFSSDSLDQGTPERPRRRDVDLARSPAESYRSPSSPPALNRVANRSMSVSFNEEPMIRHLPSISSSPKTPNYNQSSLYDDEVPTQPNTPDKANGPDEKLQQQISDILQSVPAKIRLTSVLPPINLNPPDFKMPTARKKMSNPNLKRSVSNMSLRSNGSRAGTPSFTLAPALGRTPRQRPKPGNPEIKLYHLSRSNGEAPIKLFIRCVGEHGERVMVRVGGGWADLGEYLKEYASHHGRRSAVAEASKVEVKDIPRSATAMAMRGDGTLGSTPPSRPASSHRPMSSHATRNDDSLGQLKVRKVRRSSAAVGSETPLATVTGPGNRSNTPSTGGSRSSSRLSWPQAGEKDKEEEVVLGMAGPRAKQIEMSEESKQWVESMKQKVRLASGEKMLPAYPSGAPDLESRFGELGKVGATKRLFRKPGGL